MSVFSFARLLHCPSLEASSAAPRLETRRRWNRQHGYFRGLRAEFLEERTLLALVPQILADINPALVRGAPDVWSPITAVGNVAFFESFTGGAAGLWKTD